MGFRQIMHRLGAEQRAGPQLLLILQDIAQLNKYKIQGNTLYKKIRYKWKILIPDSIKTLKKIKIIIKEIHIIYGHLGRNKSF